MAFSSLSEALKVTVEELTSNGQTSKIFKETEKAAKKRIAQFQQELILLKKAGVVTFSAYWEIMKPEQNAAMA